VNSSPLRFTGIFNASTTCTSSFHEANTLAGRQKDLYLYPTHLMIKDLLGFLIDSRISSLSELRKRATYGMLVMLTAFSDIFPAQPLLHSFHALSLPEKRWVFAHPFIAKKAFHITQEALKEAEKSKDDKRLDGLIRDGQSDALRHALWMGMLSQKIAPHKAERLGEAHEKGNYLDFLHHRAEEGALPDSVAGVMDLYNNRQGIRLGTQNPKAAVPELKELLILAILAGEMRIVRRNKELKFTDCTGKVILADQYKNQWNVPRCLVPSNDASCPGH